MTIALLLFFLFISFGLVRHHGAALFKCYLLFAIALDS